MSKIEFLELEDKYKKAQENVKQTLKIMGKLHDQRIETRKIEERLISNSGENPIEHNNILKDLYIKLDEFQARYYDASIEFENSSFELHTISGEIYVKSKVEFDKLIRETINSLNINTGKEWVFVKAYEKEVSAIKEFMFKKSLEKGSIGYLKVKDLEVKTPKKNAKQYSEKYNSIILGNIARENDLIIVYCDTHSYNGEKFPLYREGYEESFEDPRYGLHLNNQFYMEKYPFLKETLEYIMDKK